MSGFADRCMAVVVSHPGHELFVSHLLRSARPEVCVLTDGSGHDSTPRVDITRDLVADAGASIGPVFGDASDRSVYRSVLDGDIGYFVGLARTLAARWVEAGIDTVVADPYERKFLSHDLIRLVVESAIAVASREANRPIASLEFPMFGYLGEVPRRDDGDPVVFHLDDETFEWKRRWAMSYPTLRTEVDKELSTRGEEYFRTERVLPVGNRTGWPDEETVVPGWETHGEQAVTEGKYEQVVRYAEHVAPVARALAEITAGV